MPVRQMTDEERDQIFGGGLIIFDQVLPTILKKNGVKNNEVNEGKAKLSKSPQPGLDAIRNTLPTHIVDHEKRLATLLAVPSKLP